MKNLVESEILTHRFGPIIFQNTSKVIVGTLPPDSAPFYFSNSSNTRLWDILKTISMQHSNLYSGSYLISTDEKKYLLEALDLGICDIIKRYIRTEKGTVDDKYLVPIEYYNLLEVIKDINVDTLLFVYQSAAQMFLHSLDGGDPKPLNQLKKYKPTYGEFYSLNHNGRKIRCILMPNPLNRGRAGETIEMKLAHYRTVILN